MRRGTLQRVGTDPARIVAATEALLHAPGRIAGGALDNYLVSDPLTDAPFALNLAVPVLTGDAIEVRINRTNGNWVFVGEVAFAGTVAGSAPVPGTLGLLLWGLVTGRMLARKRRKESGRTM